MVGAPRKGVTGVSVCFPFLPLGVQSCLRLRRLTRFFEEELGEGRGLDEDEELGEDAEFEGEDEELDEGLGDDSELEGEDEELDEELGDNTDFEGEDKGERLDEDEEFGEELDEDEELEVRSTISGSVDSSTISIGSMSASSNVLDSRLGFNQFTLPSFGFGSTASDAGRSTVNSFR